MRFSHWNKRCSTHFELRAHARLFQQQESKDYEIQCLKLARTHGEKVKLQIVSEDLN